MTNFSYRTTRNPDMTPSAITVGSSAPGGGDVEVRITDTNGITEQEVRLALERIWLFYQDRTQTTHSGI